MGAQPDTLTSTREVWHGVPQILAQVSVAAHLATYLVEVSGFGAVLDQAVPGLPALDRGPQVGEAFLGHVGMADNVVGLADQFLFREVADLAERFVDERDAATRVGAGNDSLILGNQDFMVRNR